MTSHMPDSLIARRLVIVTGKGGTGKTRVAASLAEAARRAGRSVLVVEMGGVEHVPRLFEADPGPVGYAGRALAPGLEAMHVDPFDALAEYLALQIGSRFVVDRIVAGSAFRTLMNAAPGWRELITLGKVWHLEQQTRPGGGPRYDLIVVDAPATGHGVTFLDVPRVVRNAVRAGPLKRHSGLVEEMLEDAQRTLLLPVSLPEELPCQETAELVARVRSGLGVAIDRVVVNAVAPDPVPPDCADLVDRLAAITAAPAFDFLPPIDALREAVATLSARHALHRRYVHEIEARCELPVVCLPRLAQGVSRREDLLPLAEALERPPLPATEALAVLAGAAAEAPAAPRREASDAR